ncbi:MAG: MATE family efflux transporter, partial [Eubacteriales bacterium]
MNKSIEQEGKNQKYDSINWKQFYISVTALVIPMALQNLINVGVTAADVAMLGRVGEKVLSGASLAGQIQFVMTLILFGITSGITVLTAQYWGKRDNQAIEKILGMGMVFGVAVAIIFTIIGYFFPEQAMRIFTSDPEVIEEAVKYLRIVCFSYVLIAITQVYLYVMRSIERVVIATVVYSISLGVNIGVNAVLIFGLFGFPKLGIQGAAIGTLVARILEVTIVMFYAFFKNKIVQIRMRYMIRFDKLLVSDYVRYAMPVIVNEMIWGLGFSMHSVVIGNLGSAAVAANAVTQVLRQFSMVVVFGISNATAIYLGKTIGEGKIEETKRYAKRFLVISIIAGLLGSCVILITGPIARDVMTLSEES